MVRWGNLVYRNLYCGESVELFRSRIRLLEVVAHRAWVEVNGRRAWLSVARRSPDTVLGGVRLFLADTRPLAELEAALPRSPHRLLHGDALVGIAPAGEPLLDPERFEFPIAPIEGFRWTAEEDTGIFSLTSTHGSYPGVDIDLSEVARSRPWAVAAEESQVAAVFEVGERTRFAYLALESREDPGIFLIYGGLNRHTVRVKPGQRVQRGEPLAEVQTRTYWPRLFLTVWTGERPPQSQEELHLGVLNAFPALWELAHGPSPTPRRWFSGLFPFERFRFFGGNRRRLHAYTPVTGYGWLLGDWNPLQRLEGSMQYEWRQSLLLERRMYRWLPSPLENPEREYRFRIAVGSPGRYWVQVIVGDRRTPTSQRVRVGEAEWGPVSLPQGRFLWSPRLPVSVEGEFLDVQIAFGNELPAAIGELVFYRSCRDGFEPKGEDS
ncbi:MAG: hypothetical protein KatS3mg115_0019 [Candidatus Poribacteria bacterium]|nr:MAG: hypothetical protein KatS3mg115_0019 [Candidatus Poribacteria bacterium]